MLLKLNMFEGEQIGPLSGFLWIPLFRDVPSVVLRQEKHHHPL